MAPKSALLTAGTDDLQKKTTPSKKIPWTTREKMAAIEAKKSRPPVKQSLPPPGEMTEDAHSPSKKRWSRPKPRTTREKIKDVEGKRRATEGGQSKAKSKNGKEGSKAQKFSVYKAIQGQHIASTHQETLRIEKRDDKPSVLMRPTERAKRAKMENKKVYETRKPNSLLARAYQPNGGRQHTTNLSSAHIESILKKRPAEEDLGAADTKCQKIDQPQISILAPGTDAVTACGDIESSETVIDWTMFRIMDLPEAVRKRIWKFCVVYPNCFIWPEEKIDHEQPDLAMVNKQIRSEVLPMYYSENRFAIALIPSGKPTFDAKSELNTRGLVAIAKWSKAIEEKGWFGFIEKWAFDYTPLRSAGTFRPEEDESLVISVTFERKNGLQVNAPEIHRDARCLLPGQPEFQRCQAARSPKWLNKLVIDVVDDDELTSRKVITGNTSVELAKAIKEKAEEVVHVRCRDTSKTKRADSAIGGD